MIGSFFSQNPERHLHIDYIPVSIISLAVQHVPRTPDFRPSAYTAPVFEFRNWSVANIFIV